MWGRAYREEGLLHLSALANHRAWHSWQWKLHTQAVTAHDATYTAAVTNASYIARLGCTFRVYTGKAPDVHAKHVHWIN